MKFHGTGIWFISLLVAACFCGQHVQAQSATPRFKVIAFYNAQHDQAHISYVHEANKWFPAIAKKYHFTYDSTNNWDNLNAAFLAQYQVVIFLDARPELPAQRKAFRKYMDHGGAWMGFHFAGFALTPSEYPQDWDWYHNEFLGAGSYVGNTWPATAAFLRVEDNTHPATRHLPQVFRSSPNEWYRWSNDLRANPDIRILLSIDPSSFPLGNGPRAYETWHTGYYPVAWTNERYRMLYINMGHNDIDYEHKTNKTLSYTFANNIQDRLIIDGLLWLAGSNSKK
ncbi:ThuA domain-containing protein [Chitinophaga japonensis]|uniref:Trehalose utilization protein n=1 Tax=Chitinophaga japonensis TaxID=104662 RepID=A0A562T5E8_CHIJA|nr:ThuA domain-containing protein [Chitinophaga japonensis]TWI88767.1 trehalose utilization protein [Chitinophaga japonensis]